MCPRRVKGFTQVELLLALAVMGVVSVVGFEALRQNLSGFRRLTTTAEQGSRERVVLALMRQDLRQASLKEENFSFVGQEQRLDFVRSGDAPGVFWHVEYILGKDPASEKQQLWRQVENKNILVNDDAEPFELNYFDGSSWVKTWEWTGGIRGLPMAVRYQSKTTEAVFPIMVSVLNKGRML